MAKLTLSDLASLANQTSAIATINANNALIETALENTLSRDGTTPNTMEADLDMNGNNILNLPTPATDSEPATKGYVDAAALGALESVVTFDEGIVPDANDGAYLGTSALSWSDLFLASGGVINWNAGDVTITHSANSLAFGGGSSGYTFDADIKPATNDAGGLGTSALSWADLFLASGGVINWNAGDVTLTHYGVNTLLLNGSLVLPGSGLTVGASVPFSDAAGTLTLQNVDALDATTEATIEASIDTLANLTLTGTPTAAGATWTNLGAVTTVDINGGTLDAVTIGGATPGAITGTTVTVNTGLVPDANDGAYLGQSGTAFSDLYLASGAVIDFNAGDVTLTHYNSNTLLLHGSLVVPAAGLTVGASVPFSDSAGTLTLQNVDALDATTEATIETAIDTLANLTSIQGRTVTLADAGTNAIFGWDDTAGAYENLTAAEATAVINAFVGDSGAGGTKGAVPAPSAGDSSKYLRGDGTWAAIPGGGDMLAANNLSDVANVQTARSNLGVGTAPPQGRLTLTSAVPVTTSDVTAATTIYYTPYTGRLVPIYNGSYFVMTDIGWERSQATTDSTKSPAAVAPNSNYDLFVWNDSGEIRCTRGPAWSSATSRGTGAGTTELEFLEGFYVNKVAITNGPAARRGTYVGTVRSNASSQIDDSAAFRHVWNAYNRRSRNLLKKITTGTWTYSTNEWRQAEGSSANQVSVVIGLDEDAIRLLYTVAAFSSTATGRIVRASIGLDSTTASASDAVYEYGFVSSSIAQTVQGNYCGCPGIGYHYLAAIECGSGAVTQTWIGDGVSSDQRCNSGLSGQCFA